MFFGYLNVPYHELFCLVVNTKPFTVQVDCAELQNIMHISLSCVTELLINLKNI